MSTWCEANNCQLAACHRCFPRDGCTDHEKCREFTGSGEAYTDEEAGTLGLSGLEVGAVKPETALAVRIGAVAIGLLSADQAARVLKIALGREPEPTEVMQMSSYNRLCNEVADQLGHQLPEESAS